MAAALERDLAAHESGLREVIDAIRSACDDPTASRLSAQVREALGKLAGLTDTLEDTADALDDDTAARAKVSRYRASHARLGDDLRSALLHARRTAAANDRAALLAGAVPGADRSAVQSAVEATEALRRTRAAMASEVARSEQALSALHSSGGALRGILDEHGRLADSVASGSRTVGRIKRREAVDRYLNLCGLAFFLCVVAYVVGRRLLPFAAPLFRFGGRPTLPAPLVDRLRAEAATADAAAGLNAAALAGAPTAEEEAIVARAAGEEAVAVPTAGDQAVVEPTAGKGEEALMALLAGEDATVEGVAVADDGAVSAVHGEPDANGPAGSCRMSEGSGPDDARDRSRSDLDSVASNAEQAACSSTLALDGDGDEDESTDESPQSGSGHHQGAEAG